MAEEKEEKTQDLSEKENKQKDDALPFCTTAASAEHARGESEDEPCDDARAGDSERDGEDS